MSFIYIFAVSIFCDKGNSGRTKSVSYKKRIAPVAL